jgi:cardiolipin synthase (CMP-forming)
MARLACAPVVAGALVTGAFPLAAGVLFAAGFLDWADGWLARRWNQTTVLGAFLDPLADKVLMAATAVPLAVSGALPLPLVVLIVGRDAALMVGAAVHRARTRPAGETFFALSAVDWAPAPTALGKANTALQIGLLCAAITHGAWGLPPADAITAGAWVVGATTLGSGVQYAAMAAGGVSDGSSGLRGVSGWVRRLQSRVQEVGAGSGRVR